MIDDPDNHLGKSLNQFQKFVRQAGPSAAAAYTLMGSILFLGGIGYFIDQYFNSSPLYLLIGLGFGLVIGFYELAKSVFKK
ncbi:MAG: AtpZ/AtpI family protein [Candidatus Marinimicrobia bacterium]|jgi:F0F1-type ATP synthase assembly protein I|nr:AtpZ/AtpI family protein [Candidatus Neomarinimicrobiota bacterium]MBT3677000.1 AtpZ/AtpI family protein [Candidatus Neomarinimicrobiota bacterium]MBT3762494.1 AtpZ/AtpI family protein [Candidatus Neomarinimicrobiota bacterium]MBT4068948.1 AtpZ/AtpI family protein [Candidatus Neomarinimicrobiota bacterium]MBT4271376.1 AtpZ/AtpI family protein [Candidatus Neomarinimicrobiota bacterium]